MLSTAIASASTMDPQTTMKIEIIAIYCATSYKCTGRTDDMYNIWINLCLIRCSYVYIATINGYNLNLKYEHSNFLQDDGDSRIYVIRILSSVNRCIKRGFEVRSPQTMDFMTMKLSLIHI